MVHFEGLGIYLLIAVCDFLFTAIYCPVTVADPEKYHATLFSEKFLNAVKPWCILAGMQMILSRSIADACAQCFSGLCPEHKASFLYRLLIVFVVKMPTAYALVLRQGLEYTSTWDWFAEGIFPVHVRLVFLLLYLCNLIRSLMMVGLNPRW